MTCRICGGADLTEILDLGEMPPANAFLKEADFEREESFPLVVRFCGNCKSLQLGHTVSPALLFKDYRYATSASRPLVEHFHALAEEIAENHIESPADLVLEIGSNDGSLLSRIKDRCRVLGVDPAEDLAKIALKNGVLTRTDFFTEELAQGVKSELGEAKVIVANNVIAHIDDSRGVFSAVKELLSPGGRFIFEVHWVGNLVAGGGFDQIYHEHIYYYSLQALKFLTDSLGLVINDVKLVPIHGESMRVYVGKSGQSSEAVRELLGREIEMGLTDKETYLNFSKRIESNKEELKELLGNLKKEGKRICGYGAPGKGNTLLNYFDIGPETLDYITDTTPAKQGIYTPGSHIPVVSPEVLKINRPAYLLLLAWNYAEAILEKEKELRQKGVKFIIPVPEVRVV